MRLWVEHMKTKASVLLTGLVLRRRPDLKPARIMYARAPSPVIPHFKITLWTRMLTCNLHAGPSQYSFAGALHASMHLRDYQLALDLLQEMVDMGMPANSEGYATGIRTCARCSKSDEAVCLYADQLRMTIIPSKVGGSVRGLNGLWHAID